MSGDDEGASRATLARCDGGRAGKAFEVLGNVVLKAEGKLQVIVLDHASREVWGEIPGVVGLKEWREGIKLVPMKWLTDNTDSAAS